jgi:hypothetical protein
MRRRILMTLLTTRMSLGSRAPIRRTVSLGAQPAHHGKEELAEYDVGVEVELGVFIAGS